MLQIGGEEAKVVVAVLPILISMSAFAVSLMSFLHARRSAVIARRPILVFLDAGNDRGWMIQNLGSGPALNVIVAQKRVGGNVFDPERWFNPVRIPPLAKDGEFALMWLGRANDTGLGAVYTDFEGRPYTSHCGNDLSRIWEGQRFPSWPESEVRQHWRTTPPVP